MTERLAIPRPDGARIAVQVDGRSGAPVLVLLQGQSSAHDWWADLRRRWEDRFQTVTMDYRGTGRTVAPAGDLSTTLLADDTVAVLDALGVCRAHVYGTSMGGRVAQMIAACHAGRVHSLVLACTSVGGRHGLERSQQIRRDLADPDPVRRRAALIRLLYTPSWARDPASSRLLGDPSMSAEDRQRHLRMSARHDAERLLPNIAAPTLVLHGSEDAMTSSVNAEYLAGRIRHAQLVIYDGGRHGFFDEYAEQLDPVLARFWSGAG